MWMPKIEKLLGNYYKTITNILDKKNKLETKKNTSLLKHDFFANSSFVFEE